MDISSKEALDLVVYIYKRYIHTTYLSVIPKFVKRKIRNQLKPEVWNHTKTNTIFDSARTIVFSVLENGPLSRWEETEQGKDFFLKPVKNAAASRIQALYRGYCERRILRHLNAVECAKHILNSLIDKVDITEEGWYAARTLQCMWRKYFARKVTLELLHCQYTKRFDSNVRVSHKYIDNYYIILLSIIDVLNST